MSPLGSHVTPVVTRVALIIHYRDEFGVGIYT